MISYLGKRERERKKVKGDACNIKWFLFLGDGTRRIGEL
jgi:hypothetical protein